MHPRLVLGDDDRRWRSGCALDRADDLVAATSVLQGVPPTHSTLGVSIQLRPPLERSWFHT